MFIAIKNTDIFLSFINLNLHLLQQLMTVSSLHLSATQRCISHLPCCLCVANCKGKGTGSKHMECCGLIKGSGSFISL